MTNLDEIKEKIGSICEGRPEIIAAYLFGSQSKGKGKSGSDVDIALLLEYDGDEFPYRNFKVDLERAMDRDVDLVILNRCDEILKQQVRKYGSIIYESHREKRKRWEILNIKFYQDFLHLHRIYIKNFYEQYRVENG